MHSRDCVRLASQADSPELREKLLNLAREWMREATHEARFLNEDVSTSMGADRGIGKIARG
jgi:hypothetical protein